MRGIRTLAASPWAPWTESLHVFTLAGFAVAQPTFEILSRNAAFFAVRRSDPLEIAVLVLLLSLAVPSALVGMERLIGLAGERARARFHAVLVALLAATTALPLLHRTLAAPGAVLVAAALATGVALVLAVQRFPPVRRFLSLLSVTVVAFPALFLLGSPVSRLVFPQGEWRGAAPRPATAPEPIAPVVFILFDEFPITALLNQELEIDPIRYPHFASLARESTWFPRATTVSGDTVMAVSAILTGRYPDGYRLPTAADHPDSLFSLLGGSHAFHVLESRTQLCPRQLCGDGIVGREPLTDRLSSLVWDTSLIYLHFLLPVDWRASLPSISADWMHFGITDEPPRADRARDHRTRMARWVEAATLEHPFERPQQFLEFTAGIRAHDRPTLHFLHTLLPHVPYVWLPSGRRYTDETTLPGGTYGEWGPDEWAVTQAYQRALLQVAFVDSLLGRLVDRLKTLGLYERALVVVTADHGVSFHTGSFRRIASGIPLSDILAVPLFIKTPHQQAGSVDDRKVESVDIFPTIADVLGFELPGPIDGRSLFDAAADEREGHVFYRSPTDRVYLEDGSPELRAAVQRQMSLFGSGERSRIFAVGPAPRLVGRLVREVAVGTDVAARIAIERPESFDLAPDADFAPVYITGTIAPVAERGEPPWIAIAVNGRIQAVTRPLTASADGEVGGWSALVNEESLRQGHNTVEAFLVSDPEGRIELARATGSPYRLRLSPLEASAAAEVILTLDDEPIEIVPGALRGWVDSTSIGEDSVSIKGWAVDEPNGRLPREILVFINGGFYRTLTVNRQRPGIASWLGNPEFRDSGFLYTFPAEAFTATDTTEVRLFAVSEDRVATELGYVEGYPWAAPGRRSSLP